VQGASEAARGTSEAPLPGSKPSHTTRTAAKPHQHGSHHHGSRGSHHRRSHASHASHTSRTTHHAGSRGHHANVPPRAPAPSALTPPLPSSLALPGAGGAVPNFFIATFSIPPFLLPIYQAAGSAYGVPWQVLAAINEVETDYGRDLNVSSAGAEGWMQFLPSTWMRYGVDANGAGFEDPYNPADAIFAAARYLAAAGARHNMRAAIFAYNHSRAYVESVMLRAELLGGTPPDLLGALTGLTEDRFPVHATAHFADGFIEVPPVAGSGSQTLVGTTIYSREGAPVIAVQDGEIVGMGQSPTLGRYISLRDGYHNTYTYAGLASLASLYPVLAPRPAADAATSAPPPMGAAVPQAASPRAFAAGSEEVYLHTLRPGARVLAGTILGHLGAGSSIPGSRSGEPHMLFQIRPAGSDAPLIDPKPILDGWVEGEDSSIYHARGENPFLSVSPTPGQALLESKGQLQQQVLRDHGISLPRCERLAISAGRVDRRVLAALEFLSTSQLQPGVSARSCPRAPATNDSAASVELSSINRAPVVAGQAAAGQVVAGQVVAGHAAAGHAAAGSSSPLVAQAIERLHGLQGAMKPLRISTSAPAGEILLSYSAAAPGATAAAHTAGSLDLPLSADQWVKLIARLGQVPNPAVRVGRSAAAIPDPVPSTPTTAQPGGALQVNGNH